MMEKQIDASRITSGKLPKKLSIAQWQDVVHQCAKAHGWWDTENPVTFGDKIALCHSELSEALEEFRDGHGLDEVYYNENYSGKPEGIPIELADVIIRILDMCGQYGIDIETALSIKYHYNETRPYRHGGKAI